MDAFIPFIQELVAKQTFWQVNFWGVIGALTGISGLLISWMNWRYGKPAIEISSLRLTRINPKWVTSQHASKSIEELKNHFLLFTLDLRMRNKKGGSGSIEKPDLVISIPGKSRLFLFGNILKVRIKPSIDTDIVDGKAWNFTGGQTRDDAVRYALSQADDFYKVVQNYERTSYSIEYFDNFGRKIKKEINHIFDR